MKERVVSFHLYDPANSLFGKKSDRGEFTAISCSNAECPLLAAGQCVERLTFGGVRCPYGSVRRERGPTPRARSFYKWKTDARESHEGIPCLDMPSRKLAFIGEYVYLPYAHATLCDAVPWLQRGSLFISGNPFIPRKAWSVDVAEALIDFKPHALMGGEITSYQREQVPLFIQHLRECDPEVFAELVKRRPQLDVPPDYVGREAVLATLNAPIEWTERAQEKYPVSWRWDGSALRTASLNTYNSTWGRIKAESVETVVVPVKGQTVTVQSNEWVNENTEFKD